MTDSKLAVIQTVYAAFGRGDIPTILDNLTDDVDWSAESQTALAPWHGPKHGKAEVPSFFQALGESLEVTEFSPLSFATNDTDVMVVIRFGFRARATGKEGSTSIHHWWRFRDGKIALYRGTEDTALTQATLS